MCWLRPFTLFSTKKVLEVVSKVEAAISADPLELEASVREVVSNAVSSTLDAVKETTDAVSESVEKVNNAVQTVTEELTTAETRDILTSASVTIRHAEESASRTVAALREASDIVEELAESLGEKK